MTHIILLTSIEQAIERDEHEYMARQRARFFFRDYLNPAGYDYIIEEHTTDHDMAVLPFNTNGENGAKELVDTKLQKTRHNRRQKIKEVQKQIETSDIETLIADREFEYLCRHLHGRAESRSNVLFDGTSWRQGDAIASEETLNDTISNAKKNDMDLYCVEMHCEY